MRSFIPNSLRLLVVGLNHRTAPVTLREALAFSPTQSASAISQLQAQFPGVQCVILSTCNRVEIYLVGGEDLTSPAIAAFLATFHARPVDEIAPHLYHHQDHAAIEHLFSVASSLDSMVVGETQILGQVKSAYQLACDAQGVGKIFHALFQRALAAAKDVHEKTNLSAGRLSIASVAVDVARSVFDRFDDKTVVCVGAGEMAGLMLKHLAGLSPKRLAITNRSLERAQSVAAEFSAEARPFDDLDALLTDADILLTSTGAERPIITEARFKTLLKPRRYRPLVIVDIAVPRDVDPAIGQLSNVYLYNIDDLQEVAAGNRDRRQDEITASRQLLAGHIAAFRQWYAARDVGPVIKALYERCHQIARAELEETLAKNPTLTPEERLDLERLTHRLVGKILHGPVSELTNTGATTEPTPADLSAALRHLFNLDTD